MLIQINNQTVTTNEKWPDEWNHIRIAFTSKPSDYHEKVELIIDLVIDLLTFICLMLPIEYVDISDDIQGRIEGMISEGTFSKFERSYLNRLACLKFKGYDCAVCGTNLKQVYGEIGRDYIHVHHIIPLSQIRDEYQVNPRTDLVPVCPNCHSMLHKKTPPYTIDEMKKVILNNRNG